MAAATDHGMLIGDCFVDAANGQWIEFENPAKKTSFARVPRPADPDVEVAGAAAKRSFFLWSGAQRQERADGRS